MFTPKQLYEVIVVFPKKYGDDLIEELGNAKIVEIKEFKEEYRRIPSLDPLEIRTNEAVKALMRLDYIIEKLNITKDGVCPESENPIITAENTVDQIEEIHSVIDKKINNAQIEIDKLEMSIEFLKSVKKIHLKEDNISFLITTDNELWEELSKKLKKENIAYSSLKKRISGEKVLRFVSVKAEDELDVGKNLEELDIGFYLGDAKSIEKHLKEDLTELKDEIKEDKERIESLPKKYGPKILALKEQIQLELLMLENKRKFLCSEFTALINMWVARQDFDKLKKIIRSTTKNSYVIYKQPAQIEDNPPTKLSNVFFAKPFEMLLEGFSLPAYKEIDPTLIMAVFFPLFFGIMLGDAGYGVLVTLLALGVWFKNKSAKSFAQILLLCGFVTITVGIYFGSWFGYSLTKSHFDPLTRPIELMGVSLILGVFYVNLSLIVGCIQSIIKKDWEFLFHEIIIWVIFELGIVFIFKPELYTQHTNLPLHVIFTASPVLIRIFSKGVLNILDFPKFFSTIISFIRLAALAMSTSWISFAINLLYKLAAQFPKGIYFGIVILIVGHTFNFAFNTLGSFLQAMRLHYVEFLGQFYTGKGHKMDLFSLDRKHTKMRC